MGHGDSHHDDDDHLVRQYVEEMSRFPRLSPDEELRLAQAHAAGDETAGRRLIEANLHLVVTIARRYTSRGRLIDIIQEGNLGLMRAVEGYDGRTGTFSDHAAWCIRQAISEALPSTG